MNKRLLRFIAFALALRAYSLSAEPSSEPFIRDVATGYLLNCSFLSPKPYCWPGNDDRLSGWEVDTGGGRWQYQPNCLFPDGFAFHSDWFKLVDTNRAAAITLKHQIARQTEGPLTLEFRFKLPARMDGVCWQLRDLSQAGVGLVTRGDNLCWENGSALMPYETNREYGVKIVAEIAAKKADVFVDGERKARGLPFVNPVESIDFFQVQTGVAATGELFLNPVNIYKGYEVNETFVACGAGQVPADWEVSGGSVQPFECGTKPDIYSLQVTGQAQKKIGVWKEKTVFECRFLFPHGSGGVSVDLGGVKLERAVPYRTNFWYMAKVVADPKTGTAEVAINGKPLPKPLAFPRATEVLRFSGEMWVDDVQVYPWRDYPADYVPEPKPVAASQLLGVQSCNLWREGTAYAGWAYVYPYRSKRKPYLGWYDEGHPEETDWEIKWQVEHGIAFEQHCWYRPNNAVNHPIKDGVLDQGIVKGLFNARYSQLAKFTIMFTDEGAGLTNPQDWRENIVPYWIDYFFKDARYLKIDGKPVLSIYHLNNLLAMFGGKEGARQAIQTLRDEVAQAGFPGLILLMEYRGTDRSVVQTMEDLGVDYCYAYTWGTPDASAQRNNNLAQRDATREGKLRMLTSLSMGWDREAWGVREGGWLSVAEYRALAQWVKDEFMPSLPEDSLGRRMVLLANWNEFGEGHFLMPSALVGFGYVDALRDVFTAGGPHADVVPTPQQKSRFTALFPKD